TGDALTSALSFFFSSRRRHTRFSRDWSSDVCSSDLGVALAGAVALLDPQRVLVSGGVASSLEILRPAILSAMRAQLPPHLREVEIGRASCRERGAISDGAGRIKRNTVAGCHARCRTA